jgi:broad specificity phosphatase PhoE
LTLIYLARHGETEWNADKRIQGHTNSSLSDLGRRQAVALAERLRHCEISSIYSSDLTRAMDTAAPIAAILDLPVTPMESLRERGYGEWEGLSLDEVAMFFVRLIRTFPAEKLGSRSTSVSFPSSRWPTRRTRETTRPFFW